MTSVFKIFDVDNDIKEIRNAADILRNGGLVVFPTETVYGLGANALDSNAVSNIFKAKGRPQDNPLIVHISDISDLYDLTLEIPDRARLLAEKFWPGPLTMIFRKSESVPYVVSAGLDTVAVRMPSNEIARAIIRESGVPVAAPSANLSGSPSPTEFRHAYSDMNGRVDAIIESYPSEVGVESTVISMVTDKPLLLRPGKITKSDIESVIGEIEVDKAVTSQLEEGIKAVSPGMKYKHYSPKANVTIVLCDESEFVKFTAEHYSDGVFALCFDHDPIDIPCVRYGSEDDDLAQAKRLFSALRELDELGAKQVYARCPRTDGVGLAVYNRLLRAAGFEVIEL